MSWHAGGDCFLFPDRYFLWKHVSRVPGIWTNVDGGDLQPMQCKKL
ncbi:MAG: hypothetical protein IH899_11300 [Planctomycetes bacterium]|nr:hypothetical protein [Planctomycetota bacterium]